MAGSLYFWASAPAPPRIAPAASFLHCELLLRHASPQGTTTHCLSCASHVHATSHCIFMCMPRHLPTRHLEALFFVLVLGLLVVFRCSGAGAAGVARVFWAHVWARAAWPATGLLSFKRSSICAMVRS